MRSIKIFTLVTLATLFMAACSGGSVYVDKEKKAIISRKGDPLKTVVVDGGGKEVTFQVYDSTKDNSVIYFNKHNPGFIVSEGFGLNKDYFLRLKPSSRYSVSVYTDEKGKTPYVINFRTDYNGDITDEGDSN
jgi:hypothetical protein